MIFIYLMQKGDETKVCSIRCSKVIFGKDEVKVIPEDGVSFSVKLVDVSEVQVIE